MSAVSTKIDHYAKAVVAAIGVVVNLLTVLVGTLAFALPADYVGYLSTIITAATAVSVYITKNADKVEEIVDDTETAVRDLGETFGSLK